VWAAPLVLIAYIVGRALSPVPAVVGGTLLLVAYGTIGLRLLRNHQPAAALDTGILEHTRASNRTQDAAVQ
jgi:hypothetical protein